MTTGSRNPQCVKKWSRCVNGDDRILELSPEETRRSAVQIRTTPLARAQKLKAKCSERVKGDLDAYGIFVDKFRRISPDVDESIEGD